MRKFHLTPTTLSCTFCPNTNPEPVPDLATWANKFDFGSPFLFRRVNGSDLSSTSSGLESTSFEEAPAEPEVSKEESSRPNGFDVRDSPGFSSSVAADGFKFDPRTDGLMKFNRELFIIRDEL